MTNPRYLQSHLKPKNESDSFKKSRSARNSELQRENEHLRHQLARVQAIINGIAEGVAVSDKSGCLEVFNPAATEIMGIGLVENGHEEWSSVYGLYLPDEMTQCPTDQLPLVRAIQGEHVEAMALVAHHANRETSVHLSVTASPLYDDQGRIDGGVAIFQNVTERIRSERLLKEARDQLELRLTELKASEEKYQDLYENAPDMYATWDASTGTIVECNQTLANATGFAKNEIVGKSMFALHHLQCSSNLERAIEHFLRSGDFPNDDFVLLHKDGQSIDVSVNMSAVCDSQGQVVRGRCVWRDITQWKRTEESLARHREELAHVTRVHTAGEMATGLAHELNQPLSAIVNYSRGIGRRAKVGATITPELHQAAQATISEAQRAAEIIAGLRRLVAKQTPSRTRTDINTVVDEALLMCRGEARRRDVTIEFKCAQAPLLSTVDIIQIKQVLICLILNSVEALRESTPADRRITVVTNQSADDWVTIDVEDNGRGVPPELSDKVFEAFFTTKSEGMGMGLAISRSIVENHGGRIDHRTGANGGAVFCVSLPAYIEHRP